MQQTVRKISTTPDWLADSLSNEAWALMVSGLQSLALLLAFLLLSLVLIWYERQLLARLQNRQSDSRKGLAGFVQVLADLTKLFFKQQANDSNRPEFFPMLMLLSTLLAFVTVPVSPSLGVADWSVGVVFFMVMLVVSLYTTAIAKGLQGLESSHSASSSFQQMSKAELSEQPFIQPLLIHSSRQPLRQSTKQSSTQATGMIRSFIESLSCLLLLILAMLGVVILAGSFNLRDIVAVQTKAWYILPQFFAFVLCLLATCGLLPQQPFAKLLSQTAYNKVMLSGKYLAVLILSHYLFLLLIAGVMTCLFLGGWLAPFSWNIPFIPPVLWFMLKTLLLSTLLVFLRASLMSLGYNKLMGIIWKVCLPMAMINFFLTCLWSLS